MARSFIGLQALTLTLTTGMLWHVACQAKEDSAAPLTVDEFLEVADLTRYSDAIRDGKIVWLSAPQSEHDSNSVAGVMMARYPASVAELVDAMYTDPRISNSLADEIDDSSPESLVESFSAVRLKPSEKKDIALLLEPRAGAGFNLSEGDIHRLSELAQVNRNSEDPLGDADQASLSLQDLLRRRYIDYRDEGPAGVAAYERAKGEVVSAGENLQQATATYRLMAKYFPGFYEALEAWPENIEGGKDYVHSLTWSREEQSGRPLFVLQHSMQDLREKYAMIVQRQYYVSHTLDNLQVAMLLLPEGEQTVLVILTQTSTDKVAGMGRIVAAPIGRHMIKRNVEPIFSVLRERFGD